MTSRILEISIHWKLVFTFAVGLSFVANFCSRAHGDDLSDRDIELIHKLERQRVSAIQTVIGSVIAIYDENRQGGGSGVIIDSSGIALTNHHVIMGSGVKGWGGLADGQLYPWKLIGTDPGGDVAIIQMEGREDFPFTPLGDSDQVRVGDWALAMGNPFILTEDQTPTVTLGIVSGVKRYQPGAGSNQLVYGNCIQVDSSINPGNSGGPLFNLQGRVIGINGRGSFQDRGRVNVGLGYAISSNQIKNFIPDLLATKLVEHGTLDASFSDRSGKVVCSTINRDSPVAVAGLGLGDELLEFEGQSIKNANQFTNLICTLPEDWPASLKILNATGETKTIHVRLFGLPYQQPAKPMEKPDGKEPTPEEKQQVKRQQEMIELLSAPPGEVRFADVNKKYADQIIKDWLHRDTQSAKGILRGQVQVIKLVDTIQTSNTTIGQQELWLASDGKFRIEWKVDQNRQTFLFDGEKFFACPADSPIEELTLVQAKLNLPIVQALSMSAAIQGAPFHSFGAALIDGSDKAQQQNAYRIRLVDDEADVFYYWLRMYDETGLPAASLLKASAFKDCQDEGGVTFADWQDTDDGFGRLPMRREFVTGLEESTTFTLINQSHQRLSEFDASLFQANDRTVKKNPDGDQP